MDTYFQPIQPAHLPLIHQWFQARHIQEWYAGSQTWTIESIEQKYSPSHLQKRRIQGYVIQAGGISIGYIQSYAVKDYPWDSQELAQLPKNLAGIDFYIGEAAYLQKGYGTAALRKFLEEHVDPFYEGCLVDPRLDNKAAIRCYLKGGFAPHQLIRCQKELLLLMKKIRHKT